MEAASSCGNGKLRDVQQKSGIDHKKYEVGDSLEAEWCLNLPLPEDSSRLNSRIVTIRTGALHGLARYNRGAVFKK
jgi:hypothetical protein